MTSTSFGSGDRTLQHGGGRGGVRCGEPSRKLSSRRRSPVKADSGVVRVESGEQRQSLMGGQEPDVTEVDGGSHARSCREKSGTGKGIRHAAVAAFIGGGSVGIKEPRGWGYDIAAAWWEMAGVLSNPGQWAAPARTRWPRAGVTGQCAM
jgi:hypothetical protein